MNRLIITHANCVDGCCSCAILKEKYQDEATYLEVDYADANPSYPERYEAFISVAKEVKNGEVIMADICLTKPIVEMFLEKKNHVVIIDHHKTMKPTIDELRELKHKYPETKIEIHFSDDNTQSGAMLTWKYLNPNIEPPLIVKIVEDYDLWRFAFEEETKGFHAAILDGKQPKDYDKQFFIDLLKDETKVHAMIQKGKIIYHDYIEMLKQYAEGAEPVKLNGYSGLMVNAPMQYRSDLGDIVNKMSGSYAMIWEEQPDGIVACSLRSVKGFDVKSIAEKFGGGGHTEAAAFRVENMDAFLNLLHQEKKPKNRIS